VKYTPSLDGLRAIAVTSVVIYHAYPSVCPGGWAGVDVFFVLSGFLISTILLQEFDRSGRLGFKNFYIRRALRLLPAFACLLLVSLLFSLMIRRHRIENLENILLSASYLMNWNRAFAWLPGEGGYLAHTWSLAMEEQFYLIWPVALLLLVKVRRLAPIIIAGLVVLVLAWRLHLVHAEANAERTSNGFDVHSDTLLIGCAVAFMAIGPTARNFARNFAILPVAPMLLVLAKLQIQSALTQGIGLTFVGLCSAWIMIAAMEDGLLQRILSVRPLVYTGRISYGWYLWHYPFLVWGGHLFTHANTLALVTPLLVGASYLMAALSYHVIERPFLRLKDRLKPRMADSPLTLEVAGMPEPAGQ